MTKRDVAVWFCKVVALAGMANALFNTINGLLNWTIFGMAGLWRPVLPFGLYLFLWLFARGLGTELAAEGEHGEPLSSGTDLGSLLLRCVGLWLFLPASFNFGSTTLSLLYIYISNGSTSVLTSNIISDRLMTMNVISNLLLCIIGFLLAFTPRIRLFLRK